MIKCKKVLLYITVLISLSSLWTAVSFAQEDKTGIVTASMLNMRQSPNTSTEVIDQIPKNFKVNILDRSNGWYKVDYNGKTGWVYGSYVSIMEPEADQTQMVDETIVPGSTTAKSTETIASETKAEGTVVDETLTADIPASAPAAKTESVTQIGIVNASTLNVREGAGTEYKIVDKLDRGEKVSILAKENGWYKIKMSNGTIGWVSSTYISTDVTVAARGEDEIDETLVVPEDLKDNSVSDTRRQVVAYAKKFLGVRYVYGGSSPSGFDCSGYVKYVFDHFGVKLERVAASQAKQGKWVSKANLVPGDLVFFDTNGGHNHINHVGIYIGDGKFIHASSGRSNKRVVISDITSGFYATNYMTARKVLN
ncbi:MAG: SH3 domain-containing protein [Bacillota bacterium]